MFGEVMRAVRMHGFGDESVLVVEKAPIPQPGLGDVLVRVHAAAVNPVDSLVRRGVFAVSDRPLPWIPGWDFAGSIVAVGSAVTKWSVGDLVYGRPSLARDGSYAQYLAVDAAEIAKVPRTLSMEAAAAVPLVTLTAWKALFDLGALQPGGTALVHAGAGGVGTMAVQLARHRGAKVVATASGDGIALARSLGADEVIDHRNEDFVARGRFADVVLDTVGGHTLERSYSVVLPGGALVTIAGTPDEQRAAALGISVHTFVLDSNGPRLSEVAALIDAQQLRPVVTHVLDLDEVAQAHRLIDSGRTRGKIVLRVT